MRHLRHSHAALAALTCGTCGTRMRHLWHSKNKSTTLANLRHCQSLVNGFACTTLWLVNCMGMRPMRMRGGRPRAVRIYNFAPRAHISISLQLQIMIPMPHGICRFTTYRHRFARVAPAPRAKRRPSTRHFQKIYVAHVLL